jgi:hypothetical protein
MRSVMARHARTVGLLVVFGLGLPLHAVAQAPDEPSFAVDVFKRVVFDPTTYVPAAVAYHSFRLDWDTSQVLFQHGFKEINPRFTVSGYSRDMPISYQAGNRRILDDAVGVFGTSLLNNLIENVFERALLQNSPDHRRLIRTLGWIERITFASYLTYRQSSQHFEQAARNRQMAAQSGFR